MRVQFLIIPAIILLSCSGSAVADYKDDIGYSRLVAEQGVNTLTGTGVRVTQVEASTAGLGNPAVFLPDAGVAELSSKNITDKTDLLPELFLAMQPVLQKRFMVVVFQLFLLSVLLMPIGLTVGCSPISCVSIMFRIESHLLHQTVLRIIAGLAVMVILLLNRMC
jgi:hypothetical protein